MSTKKTDDTTGRYSEICGATNNRGEPCSLPAGWGTPGSGGKRCRFHGGASTGPSDTSHLEGNDFAKDNSGGGPPTNNTNAEVHGGWSDPDKFYDRLEGDAKEYVDELTECHIDRSKADLPDDEIKEKAQELAVLQHQWSGPAVAWLEDGLVVTREREANGEVYTEKVVHPAFEAEIRLSKRKRKLMRELRVFSSPDGCPWTEYE